MRLLVLREALAVLSSSRTLDSHGRTSFLPNRPLSVVCALNGGLWVTYGLAVSDPFIFIPNGFGLVVSSIQLFFCAIFPRGTTKSA